MNLSYVLSWSSSVSSLPSLDSSTNNSTTTREGRADYKCGKWQRLQPTKLTRSNTTPTSVTVTCRASNGDSRRPNSYNSNSSSSSGRGSNAVSSRPRGLKEQSNGTQSSNGNSEGSKGRYGDGKSGSRNSGGGRTSGGNGGGGGRGGGGYNRGRGVRRDREAKMHPGAYKMRDEETGELVVVWGVEDDDDIPMPTAADLNWRKSTVALPGDASEETWAKVMEDASGSTGEYRVRGAEPEGKDWTENLFEEDLDDDFEEDDDLLDDEDDSESEEEELIESPKVPIARAPRVRVFGRDLWGRSQTKVDIPEKDTVGLTSESFLHSSDAIQGVGMEKPDSLTCDQILGYTEGITSHSEDVEGRIGNEDKEPQNSVQQSRNINFKEDDCLADGRGISKEDDQHVETNAADNTKAKFAETTKSLKSDKIPKERSRAAKTEDKSLERFRATNNSNESTENVASKPSDRSTEGRRNVSLQNDDKVINGRDETSSGSFNPYIIDISEEDSTRSQFKDVRKSGLLDRLRSQVLGKSNTEEMEGDDTEEASSPAAAAKGTYTESADTSSKDSIRAPMRDLTARDNYDASIADDFYSSKSFKVVGAIPEVIQALAYLNVQKPSQIQAMAFKPILEGKSCIIAEQTGSGKTLAYVAPLVQRLKADEARTLGKSLSKKPRVLVLVPTGELAAQVLSNFRALSKGGVPCRSIVLTGGFKWKTQVESLEGGADVVVATPGRLLQHLDAGNIHFDNLKSVVLDEVDILFDDEEFSKALQTINKAASIKVQYIHVTATLPVDIHDDLLERYPDCLSLMGPSLHRTATGLQEVLVDCSGGEQDDKTPESAFANKRNALLQLVEERPVAKTIIFCNKVETCRKVENVLTRFDRSGKKITVLPYHAALSQETRFESMETFLKSPPKERLFLVCTDRASRGIDSLDVEHVVLFDFPRDPSEYVRRVGRTARGAGGTGKVFAFVVGRQVGHARRIMTRNDKGEPVHDVPGSRYYYRN
ncbi:unnamed protein product [Calypogeia fissa]